MSEPTHPLLPFPPLSLSASLVERCQELSSDTPIPGFLFAGVHAGIKRSSEALDVGLISCTSTATCAGVYTQNQVVAAPVTLSRRHLASTTQVRAVIVNSGNANACTGEGGDRDALLMANSVVDQLLESSTSLSAAHIQVASTGVIGAPLPIKKLTDAIPMVVSSLESSGLKRFATAIMTTDNRPKSRALKLNLKGVKGAGETTEVMIAGCSKGAGMIHPNMATMLSYLCTDAKVAADDLQKLWVEVCDHSFNAITIDGDTSTNDTALILASGESSPLEGSPLQDEALSLFIEATRALATALAVDILRDGEGVEHVAHLTVRGARTSTEARQVAETIALSPLVKTAMNGEDPNWGRIIAAVGRSGVEVDPSVITLCIGGEKIYDRGQWCGLEAEEVAHQAMCGAEYPIEVDLSLGVSDCTLYTTDLSAQYVRINADYRS